MQTSIAYIEAGYRNSLNDEIVVEKPGRTSRRQNKADTTNTKCGGSSKENLPSFWKIASEIYVGLGPSCSCITWASIFKSAASFFSSKALISVLNILTLKVSTPTRRCFLQFATLRLATDREEVMVCRDRYMRLLTRVASLLLTP